MDTKYTTSPPAFVKFLLAVITQILLLPTTAARCLAHDPEQMASIPRSVFLEAALFWILQKCPAVQGKLLVYE